MGDHRSYYKTKHWHALRAECERRAGGMCQAPGCIRRGLIADHIDGRPLVPYPTPLDTIDNLRWLCRQHDQQIKQLKAGRPERAQGGQFKIKGADVDGWPLDPKFNR